MKKINELSYVIIRILELADGPMTGYDINKIVQEHFEIWSHQMVYRYLSGCMSELVERTEVHQEGLPNKKPYTLKDDAQWSYDVTKARFETIAYFGTVEDQRRCVSHYEALIKKLSAKKTPSRAKYIVNLATTASLESKRGALESLIAMKHHS